jgi:hypothetical protein
MIRKIVLSSIALVALTFGGFAATAVAQTATPTPFQCTAFDDYNNCIDYPDGGFGNPGGTPTATPRPASTSVPSATAVPTTPNNNNAIAFTGSESRVLGYAGAGLIGFGAIALAVARRKSDTELD